MQPSEKTSTELAHIQQAIDPKALEKILAISDQEFVVEMIDIFLADGEDFLTKLELGFAQQDWQKITQTAHGFKSISAAMGASGLSKICWELEAAAKARVNIFAEPRLAKVQQEYELVRSALAFYRQNYTG
ncbi:MAG: Hpt domain-containing protein [Pseudanabaenaceae cyanobacterium bins.68]|nr:Hpt domain-containing protein [Pseudanabaenaceae cyanobacterium bins.68]